MKANEDETEAAERVSLEQLQDMNRDEQSSMLFYLTGYLKKSAEFQDAMGAAYAAHLRSLARLASRG